MGFYGNIANSVKTSLTFDKKYSSRYDMDQNVANDGVYAGRYVLVEYGLNWQNNYNNEIDYIGEAYVYYGVLYKDSTYANRVDTTKNKYFKAINDNGSFWIYLSNFGKFEKISPSIPYGNSIEDYYITNFNIDKKVYGKISGYDSTVWTKVYDKDGNPSYVMVAELNSITPVFNLYVDQHGEKGKQLSPYFDEDSSNLSYNLHVTPNWDIQMGSVDFNKAAFEHQYKYSNNSETNLNKKVSGSSTITLTPISSGELNFGVNGKEKAGIDTLRLDISIPEIGNTISDFWDIIYGEHRNKQGDSLLGKLEKLNNGIEGIQLSGYVEMNDTPSDITNSDTIVQAFAKLQKQINILEQNNGSQDLSAYALKDDLNNYYNKTKKLIIKDGEETIIEDSLENIILDLYKKIKNLEPSQNEPTE